MNVKVTANYGAVDFLSCLCGSEPFRFELQGSVPFLSCLCGSEHKEARAAQNRQFSELPMRQ